MRKKGVGAYPVHGRLPGTWALTLTRPKTGGGGGGGGRLPGILRYISCSVFSVY